MNLSEKIITLRN